MIEPRFHRHVVAENGGPLWRHGRAWFSLRGAGRRPSPRSHMKARQDLGLAFEWRLFPKRGDTFGVGFKMTWGTGGSDTTPDLSLHLGRIGDLWILPSGLIPHSWLERHKPDGTIDWDTRVFSFNVGKDATRWEWWARKNSWSRSDPWWMSQTFDYKQIVFGKNAHTCEVVEEGVTVVPMPEHPYPATWRREIATWRYTRPLGRLRDRLLGPRSQQSVWLTPGEPVPVPGKGENSWDCDDDAIHGCGGKSVEDAVANMVRSALSKRQRYGGLHMNAPDGAA